MVILCYLKSDTSYMILRSNFHIKLRDVSETILETTFRFYIEISSNGKNLHAAR